MENDEVKREWFEPENIGQVCEFAIMQCEAWLITLKEAKTPGKWLARKSMMNGVLTTFGRMKLPSPYWEKFKELRKEMDAVPEVKFVKYARVYGNGDYDDDRDHAGEDGDPSDYGDR